VTDIFPAYLRSGTRYRCYGIPGSPDAGAICEVHSMTRSCQLNTMYYVPPDRDEGETETVHFLITIGLADFLAAVNAGWMRHLPTGIHQSIDELFEAYPARRHPEQTVDGM
jgi:hypothetical protein